MEPTKTAKRSANRKTRPSEKRVGASSAPKGFAAISKEAELAQRAALGVIRSAAALANDIVPAAAPSTNLVGELNNIDFQKMIGGPLQACVDAQVASSLATVNFINAVGFTAPVDGKRDLVMVDFSHKRKDSADDPGKEITLRVPLLAMLPIPSLRIEHVTIDFNVKLNSVESSSVSDDLKVNADVSGGFGPVKFKVSVAIQRKATTGVEVKKEFAINVNVKAVQDEIPAGLEKILNMLAA